MVIKKEILLAISMLIVGIAYGSSTQDENIEGMPLITTTPGMPVHRSSAMLAPTNSHSDMIFEIREFVGGKITAREQSRLHSLGITTKQHSVIFSNFENNLYTHRTFYSLGFHSPFMTAGHYIDKGLLKTTDFVNNNRALSVGLGLCTLGLIGYSTLLYQGRTAPGMDLFKKYIANNAKSIFNSAAAKTVKGGLKTANNYTFGALYDAAANRFDKLFPVVK